VAKSLARQAGTSARTLYRWLGAYLEGGLRELAPAARGLSRGAALLDPRVEEIIEKAVLEAFAAGESSVTVLGLIPSIQTACEALPPGPDGKRVSSPGRATVQRRLSRLRKDYKNHKGETRRVLRDLQQPVTGSIDARRALEIVEIDHTVMDVHAVDAETLEPIGRPTFTIAIDDFTRCVLAFVLGGKLIVPTATQDIKELIRTQFPDMGVVCSAVPEVAGDRDLGQVRQPRDLADVDVAVVRAILGIAESGSVLFTESELKVNTLAYLAQHLVVLLAREAIVPGLQDAYENPRFRTAHYAVFHTGPSATADIEGVLLHGAQGVRSLSVVLTG
jgi:L-lactate dehydrogenase complex protein LldG